MTELLENERDQPDVETAIARAVDANVLTYGLRLREGALTGLLGGMPRPIGTVLRRLFYPLMFGHFGRGTYIQEGCEFLGANRIDIKGAVKILRDVRLNITTRSLLRVGNDVCLDRGVDINTAGEDCVIEIGEGSYLGPYVCMAGPGHIKIGKHCLIASQSGLYANNHRVNGLSREGIEIEDHCWLGTGVKILDGVTIGRGSVIGAGSVVTKNIPPSSIAVGVPAKVIKASKGEGVC
jgi:acetyltransferase-like isoleucine patch superfamily enzyme